MGNVVAATAQFTPPSSDLERHRELLEPRRGAMKGLAHSVSSKVARWAWCGMPGREGLGGGRGTALVSGLLHWRLEASRQLTGSVEG